MGTVYATRKFTFSAAHRYWRDEWTADENARVFGQLTVVHGHNYVLEVTLAGPISPATGMVANLDDLDAFVAREVLEPFDHRCLNAEIPEFAARVPTAENLCREIHRRLRAFPGARLARVRLEETSLNSFEYCGETEEHHP